MSLDETALRERQSACYRDEDFARYFALADELAGVSTGYVRSYEFWLQTLLHELARATPDLVFLQVGAMDGKRYDPVYAFIKHYRWRGLVLEPLPDLFAALSRHYADQPQVTLVSAAMTGQDGPGTMTRVDSRAVVEGAVPFWAEGLGSFFPERNALGGVGVGIGSDLHDSLVRHSRQESVTCVTLRTLAARHDLARLDLLQVDAEGCELDILRQVDAHGFRPRIVHLEHWALSARERGELLGLLGERGYYLRMSQSDVLAIDDGLRAAIDAKVGWSC